MDTIDLLTALQHYISLLTTITTMELTDPQIAVDSASTFKGSVSLQYDFITLTLDIEKKEHKRNSSSRYLECTFEIDQGKVFCTNVYCERKDREIEIKKFILDNSQGTWNTSTKVNHYNNEILRYLTLADSIAKVGHLCSSGDNYRPGYYSEILVEDSRIVLRQINRWNSKSLDHRDDYHMRDLEFFIPLHPTAPKPSLHDYQIGQMMINFSDGSSKNNRSCGDRIREKIREKKIVDR